MRSIILVAVVSLSGCAAFRETPPTYAPFMDTTYFEVQADPGRVLDERVKLGPTKAGERLFGSPTLCGFVDFARRWVWIARSIDCPLDETRRHERCHVDAHAQGVKDECHDGRSFSEAK